MKRRFIEQIGLLVVCCVFCVISVNIPSVSADTLTGTWVDSTDSDEYLTFRTDGTWEWTDNQGAKRSWGTWSQSGKNISVRGTDINGNTFSTTGTLGKTLFFPQFVELNADGTPHTEEFRKL